MGGSGRQRQIFLLAGAGSPHAESAVQSHALSAVFCTRVWKGSARDARLAPDCSLKLAKAPLCRSMGGLCFGADFRGCAIPDYWGSIACVIW
jgi:hypothetical protein